MKSIGDRNVIIDMKTENKIHILHFWEEWGSVQYGLPSACMLDIKYHLWCSLSSEYWKRTCIQTINKNDDDDDDDDGADGDDDDDTDYVWV